MEYTVKEIADVLETSKPTVQTKINNLKIKAEYKENQTNYYSENDCRVIIAATDRTRDTEEVLQLLAAKKSRRQGPKRNEDNEQGVAKVGEKDRQTPPSEEVQPPSAMQQTIDILTEQLKTKDAQIEKLQLLLAQQQQITLSLEKKEEQQDQQEKEEEKKGFLAYVKDYFKK